MSEGDRPPFLVPGQVMPIDRFWRHFQALDIEVVCPRPPDFSIDPSLAGRIRSALGPALRELGRRPGAHLRRRRRLWSLPSAFEAFYGEPLIAPVPAGELFHNPTRPFLLHAWGALNRIHVRLRLFGRGAIWQQEAEAGLRLALESRVQLAPGSRSRAALAIERMALRMAKLELQPGPWSMACFDFSSPVAFERRDAVAIDRDMLFGSILSRMAGIAAWHGMLLTGPWGDLAEEAASARIDASELKPIGWTRRSYRQHGRLIDMKGLIGRLQLHGRLDHWLPLLAPVASTGLGSHTTLGLGRCRIRFE